jgi:hypothetical protein
VNREVADVRVHGTTGELPIVRFADDVADHSQCEGRRQRVIERTHLAGLVGAGPARAPMPPASPPALLRPLAEYEAVVGGVDHETLVAMLDRLKLTTIRDQLDTPLDEAARSDMTLREALAFLVGREIARRDERRISMASKPVITCNDHQADHAPIISPKNIT